MLNNVTVLLYVIGFFLVSPAKTDAQDFDFDFAFINSAYVGHWNFNSSKGYTGSLLLDDLGGCSYFISSAMLSLQATCVSRELGDGRLLVYGTQEGTSNAGPVYGEQLDISNGNRTMSTAVSFMINSASGSSMSGDLITSGGREHVQFYR